MSQSSPDTLQFRIPQEPDKLRYQLRLAIGADPADAKGQIVKELASHLERVWRSELRDLGVAPRDFRAVLEGYGRETWLWVMKDRTWEQMASGLVGRVVRRAGH